MFMKIAIIGSGIAGLTAAYRLGRDRIGEVTLLERQPRAGIDAHRVEVTRDGHRVSVDVPSRMFNHAQWPNLVRLYDEIGVKSVPVNTSQSFSMVEDPLQDDLPRSYLRNEDATRPGQLAKHFLSRTGRRIGLEALRFFRVATNDLRVGEVSESTTQTLSQYLRRREFDEGFIYRFLYPTLASTVCTCRYESLDRYPAYVVLDALSNIVRPGKLQRTRRGTSDVAERLSKTKTRVLRDVTVESIRSSDGHVEIDLDSGHRLTFDHVVVATPANTALSLLANPCRRHRELLGSIRYDEVPVAVHEDARLMPSRKSHWSTFNMLTEPTATGASCTVWLNRYYGTWALRRPLFQTIGTVGKIDPSKVMRSTTLFRSVVDQDSLDAIGRLERFEQEPDCRLWFCGSWAARGVPLLESAVVSAQRVAQRIKTQVQILGGMSDR